jgi:hypothetical protein
MGGLGGPRVMGGMGGFGGMRDMGSHRAPVPTPPHSSSSFFSSNEAYRAYTFPDHIPHTIPSVVFPRDVPPPPGGHPHILASVASLTAPAVSPLRSLPRGNISTSSASDLTLLGWPPSAGVAPPVVVSAPPPSPPSSSSSSSSTFLAPLAKPSLRPAEPFKLSEIKGVKRYLDLQDEIAYYLCSEEYGTRRSDDLLITDPSNTEASHYWEGQLWVAVRNGGLRFLFENTGSRFHGKGFEMLDVLNRHCRPDSVTDAFATLMSLFNDVQGDSGPIVEFRSRVDGMIMDMSRCKVVIPPLLLVMIFIRALHTRYSDILDQFVPVTKIWILRRSIPWSPTLNTTIVFNWSIPRRLLKRVVLGHRLLPLINQARNGRLLTNGSLPSPSKLSRLDGTGLLRVQASAQSAIVPRSLGTYLPIALF